MCSLELTRAHERTRAGLTSVHNELQRPPMSPEPQKVAQASVGVDYFHTRLYEALVVARRISRTDAVAGVAGVPRVAGGLIQL